jgi:hypothetical protein
MSQPSDRMLELLQQISVLDELDEHDRAGAKRGAAVEDSRERRKKRREIRDEMKKLAAGARRKLGSKSKPRRAGQR